MKYRIEITTDNAAFGEGEMDRAEELAAILREMAKRLDSDGFIAERPIRDTNGNIVGNIGEI